MTPLDPSDSEPSPPIFSKMDALMAKHRGAGPNQSIPVLTEIASPFWNENTAKGKADAIPVLTEVATMIGDDLMFTPDEIRPDETEAPAPAAAPAVEQAQRLAVPAAGREASAAQVLTQAPVAARPAPPAAEKPPVANDFGFPDLRFDDSALNTPAAKSAPPMAASVPKPIANELLMPELKLDFDFAPPPETLGTGTRSAAAPSPAAVPSPNPGMTRAMMESHTIGLRIDLPTESEDLPPTASVFESATVGLRIDVPPEPVTPPPARPTPPVVAAHAAPPAPPPLAAATPRPASTMPEAGALANELMAALKPEIEKMVRAEMSKQIALLHSAAIKNVLVSLQPKIGPLVAEAVRQVLARRDPP